jgi:3-hydroxyacyl-CoA dehydrogenase / enoyl-CoA hydratase / 3-hydroxybutyryl-CoA epimerase
MRATRGKYPAPKEALKVIMKSRKLPREKAFDLESQTFSRLAMTNVSKNLVGIFFAQNESKKMPAGIAEKPNITTVGVLGAGVMGAGIAQACAKAGYKVIVKDIEQKFLDKGKQTISGLFEKLVERKKMTREEMDKVVGEIVFTTDYAAMADCDLVIEAVLEDLELKKRALAELDQVIKKRYTFATNTSSLSVTKIAEGTSDPGKVVGLHFFNPVHKMPLVEIVKGAKSSNEAIAAAMIVALKLDKTTVITNDAPGFVVNRILAPYLREAAVLAEEGVPIPDIDKAMKNFGMPMGPLALLDEIGLDVAAKVIHVMHDALGDRMAPPPLMSKIEALKLLGKKGGKGIYTYDEKGKPAEVNPEVQNLIGASENKKLPGEIQDRLVLLMLNEAARCMEEKIVEDPAQLDLAMIFGTGFAPFTGGILKYADTEGIQIVYDKLTYLSRVLGSRYEPCPLLKQMAAERKSFYPVRVKV